MCYFPTIRVTIENTSMSRTLLSMNKRIIKPFIHIGYHKTGSSWLQQHLFTTNSKVFYPLSKNDAAQTTLAKHFVMDDFGNLLSPFNQNEERIKQEISHVLTLQGAIDGRIPVISQERLSGSPGASGFDAKNIAYRLKTIFPDARILIVVREQKSVIRSWYFQHLAMGGTESFKQFFSANYDSQQPYFSLNHFDYLPLVKEYENLFGLENILVLNYELFRHQPTVFFQHMESFLNVQLPIDSDLFTSQTNKMTGHFVRYHARHLNRMRRRTSFNRHAEADACILGTATLLAVDTLPNRPRIA